MRNAINRFTTSLELVLILAAVLLGLQGAGAQVAAKPPYLNPALPVEVRVKDLIGRMTLEEKTAQLYDVAPAIPRLNVPEYFYWTEALHGHALDGVATVFPQAIGLAATWDTKLHLKVASAISTEVRAHYNDALNHNRRAMEEGLTVWSPNVNNFRDPRWGRGQETYGEDPFLSAQFGVAFVRGMQGNDPKYLKTVATPKHFAVHSGPEPARHTIDVSVSKHDMLDTYLPAFRDAVVEGGAGSVMCSYNSVNGEPACANEFLLGDELRKAWHFDGFVVSDCLAIDDIDQHHHYTKNSAESAAISLKRGTDMDCDLGMTPDHTAYLRAIQQGLLKETDVDHALERIFTARFRLGMFDPPEAVPYSSIPFSENDSAEHRELSLVSARESLVLLKNNGILPLKQSPKRIAVIGPLADTITPLLGSYNGVFSSGSTILAGLRERFPNAAIDFAAGTDFLVSPNSITSQFLSTPDGKPGLSAEYYTNKDFSGAPTTVRVDSTPSIGFGGLPMPQGVGQGPLSVRWTGRIKVQAAGTYELSLRGGSLTNSPALMGGVRIWIDGRKILDAKEQPFSVRDLQALMASSSDHATSDRVANVQLDHDRGLPPDSARL